MSRCLYDYLCRQSNGRLKNPLEQVIIFGDVVEYKVSLLKSFSFYLLPTTFGNWNLRKIIPK